MSDQKTIFQVFQETVKKYPTRVALGWKVNGHYKTISYERLLERVNRLVAGLRSLGIKEGDKVAIFSKNRPEWVKMDLALNKIGATCVPIHTTFSPRLIKYILQNSGAEFIAIGDLFSKFQEIEKEVSVQKIITFNRIDWRPDTIFVEDLFKVEPDNQPAADFEINTIIYTSGTTGDPKGVILANQNFISDIKLASQYVPYSSRDVLFSFMPLSHVLERTATFYTAIYFGASIYFAESAKTIAEDIKKVKPTIMVSVPRIFERVYEKVIQTVKEKSILSQNLFYGALRVSRRYLLAKKSNSTLRPLLKILHYFADKLILSKVRHNLGGHLKFSISGGSSLNISVARFFEAIGIIVLEGFGLTETSPVISVNPLNNYKFGTVGKVIPEVEVKIAPDKEILVKGPNVMAGYYNNPLATKESFTEDGYFRTGDLGHLDAENYLTIIGRKKEMLVLSTGKNVNPVDLENTLQLSKYIGQAMVIGDRQKYLSALIVPDFENLKEFASERNLKLERHELIMNPLVLELFRSEINLQLKDFPQNEQVAKFALLEYEFSEEREELTPTLKLKRKNILEHYRGEVAKLGS